MSFFTQQTEKIVIDDKHFAMAKKLNFGELSDATSAATIVDAKAGTLRVDVIALQKEMYVRSIYEWSGPNFEGRPVTRENLLALPPQVAKILREGAEALNKEIDKEEGNESAAPTNS
jgi:hypothetical protein